MFQSMSMFEKLPNDNTVNSPKEKPKRFLSVALSLITPLAHDHNRQESGEIEDTNVWSERQAEYPAVRCSRLVAADCFCTMNHCGLTSVLTRHVHPTSVQRFFCSIRHTYPCHFYEGVIWCRTPTHFCSVTQLTSFYKIQAWIKMYVKRIFSVYI